MKGFDVLKVKSAVKNHNKFDLSRTHLTTMDFGEIVPLFVEETVPGDKFNVSGQYFSRLAPLVKPVYGNCSFRTVAAFVPYHQIAVDAEAWLAGKTTMEGQTPHHRFFTVRTFHDFLTTECLDIVNATSANTEYTWIDSAGTTCYGFLTRKGKYYVKILNSLGYALPQNVDLRITSDWVNSTQNTHLSAYPLLAFFKLYNDYMSQSQRFNTSQLSDVLYKVKNGITDATIWTAGTGAIITLGLRKMFDNLLLNYDNDYFTSAWQKATNPINSTESVAYFYTPVTGEQINNYGNDTNLNVTAAGGVAAVGQRALDLLKDFDDWVRRNNYSGSRAVQQIYSRFGIKPDDFRAHYAHVLKTDVIPVQVGDVTSTASSDITKDGQTVNIALGDYSGKGIVNGNNGISVNIDDFGMLFILGYFTVVPMMSYGSDRRVLRAEPLDYYNPEFDGVGADAISLGEVYANPTSQDATKDTDVFGYTERYNSYRYGRDVITGEFRDYDKKGDMNVWHFGRNLTSLRSQNMLVAQSSAMNTLPQTDSEYNRIFADASADDNHFYVTAQFKVDAIRPMLNLNQVPRLGEGDTVVPRNGNVIS